MADSRDVDRLTEELAKAHEELRMTRLVLARVTVELAQEKAKNLALHHAIDASDLARCAAPS